MWPYPRMALGRSAWFAGPAGSSSVPGKPSSAGGAGLVAGLGGVAVVVVVVVVAVVVGWGMLTVPVGDGAGSAGRLLSHICKGSHLGGHGGLKGGELGRSEGDLVLQI